MTDIGEENVGPIKSADPIPPALGLAPSEGPTHEDVRMLAPMAAATNDWCIATSKIDGLNIRARPTSDAASLGQLNKGSFAYADCNGYGGAPVSACGGLTKTWVAVWHNNVWGYVPNVCVEWRLPKP